MNKLGFQIERFDTAQRQMIEATNPYTLKVLQGGKSVSAVDGWRARRPDGVLVCRYVFDPGPLEDAARRVDASIDFFRDLLPFRPWLEVPFNEEHQNGDALIRLAEASIGMASKIKAEGFRPVVLITSEGNPHDLGQWSDGRLHAALRELRKLDCVWGAHEYSAPPLEPLDGWHSGRWRKVYDILPEDCWLSVYFGECGIDGGVNTGRGPQRLETGWRGYMDGHGYRSWLNQLADAYAADPRVCGAAVFLSGTFGRWASFDIGDEVDLREPFTRQIPGPDLWVPGPVQEVPPPPPPPPPPAVKPSTGKGTIVSNIQVAGLREAPAFYMSEGEGNYSKVPRKRTTGVVIHSTGGSASVLRNEYVGAVNWFQSPDAGVSPHYTIGPDEVARSVDDDLTAYHAREENARRIGIEFAHADEPKANLLGYMDYQYRLGGEIVGKLAAKYGFPLVHVTDPDLPGLIYHRDTATGKKERRDPTGPFDIDRLIAEAKVWLAREKPAEKPPITVTPVDKPPTTGNQTVTSLLDESWSLADAWERAGYSWTGQGIKAIVALRKGEK